MVKILNSFVLISSAEVLTLVQIIALFNITPKELKLIFNTIQREDWAKVSSSSFNLNSQPYWDLLIHLLQRMALPREDPDSYFDFGGTDSVILSISCHAKGFDASRD